MRTIREIDDSLADGLYAHMDRNVHAPPVFAIDPQAGYRVCHANAACRLIDDNLVGMLLQECIPALTSSRLDRLWAEIGESGMAMVESECRTAAGNHITIEILFSRLEHDGRYLMAGHVRDITRYKRQEGLLNALLEQEWRFSRMAEHLPGFVYTFRKQPDGHASFPYTSSGIRDLYGLQPEDVADDVASMIAVTHPDDLPAVLAAIEKSITTRTPYSMEFRVCHPQKGVRWVESKSRPDLGPDGSVLFHGMMLDVTQRKRTESVLSFIAQRGWKEGDESFLTALARHMGEVLGVDYVLVDKLGDAPAMAETVALYAKGAVLPNMQYGLKGTPCEGVLEGSLCSYPNGIQAAFPDDTLLVDMQAESYAGQPLWDSAGKVIGLIAVLDGKPMQDMGFVESILKLVATRVAAELERDLSEQALAESRQFLQQVIDTVADPVFVKDRQHRWLLLNESFCRLIGQPKEALLGKSDYDFFPEDEASVFWEKDELVFTLGAESVNEEAFTDGDGVKHTIITSKSSFTDSRGETILVGTIKDITALRAAGERLELLENAVDLSSDAIYLIDENLRFNYVNDAACRALGYNREELLAMGPADIDPDLDVDFALEMMRTTPLGTRISFETRHRTLSGRIFPVELNASHFERDGVRFSIAVVRDITERKRLERAMAGREREFRSLAENLPDNIARWSLEGRILVSNPTHQRTLGKPADELIGKTHREAFPDDRYRPVDEAIAQVVNTGELVVFVRQLVPAENGEMRIHDIKLVPEHDEAGRIVSVLGIGRDMTDSYRMQEAVAAREQEFRSLAENLPDNIGRWDAGGRYIYVNPTYERTLRTSSSAVMGKTVAEAFPERRDSPVALALARVLATGNAERAVRQLLPDGQGDIRIHDVNLMPEKDAEGRVVGVLGIGRDMTDYYRMQEAIIAREQDFRTLAENAPEPIVRYDKDCRRVYANPACARDSGMTRDEISRKTPLEYWLPTNLDAEHYMAVLREVMQTGKDAEVLLEWQSEEGHMKRHSLHLVAEYDINGEVQGVLAIGHDVSASRKAEVLAGIRMSIFERLTSGSGLATVVERVVHFVEYSNPDLLCSIMLIDADGQRLSTVAAPSLPDFFNEAIDRFAIGESFGCYGTDAWRVEAVLIEDVHRHPDWEAYRPQAAQAGIAACWSFPLQGAGGIMLGTFAVYRRTPGLPSDEDMALIREASHLARLSVERKRTEEKLMRQASYDALTGLPNRRLFANRLREEISRAERNGYQVGLLFIDLDRFKEVNDNLGHDWGDSLLIEAARRIRQHVRISDSVARLGGDEFVVILPEFGEITHLGRVAQDVIDAMAEVFDFGEQTAYLSASIGIACYPADADTMDGLVGCADQAMYAAKQQGRNGFCFFTAAMQQQAQQRMQLANDLRDALQQGQLQVHYQPIIDIARQSIVKAEALLRWRHPVRGMIPPDHFIPIAEETGLIHEIGEWVFGQAVGAVRRWREADRESGGGHETADFPQITVNMSPRQFMRENVGSAWAECLQTMGVPAEAVVIEITEGLLLGDQEDILEKLKRFRAAGMRIALDDFGTGYSAMAYLKKFPIDYLKIDRSFVRDIETDINDRAITEAIVAMSRKLGLQVVAEGVETERQRDILAAVGCEYVQGYLYARPMPEDEFLTHVSASNRLNPVD